MTVIEPLFVGSSTTRATAPATAAPIQRALRPTRTQPQPDGDSRPAGTAGHEPPTPGLPLAVFRTSNRTASAYYVVTTIDLRGRLADRSPLHVLDWPPGLRVALSPGADTVTITPQSTAADVITSQGHVRLPARIRHACRLAVGDRLLVVADPDHDRLIAYIMSAVDAMIARRDADMDPR